MNVTQAIEILREKGYKFTDKREMMLEIFHRENRYLAAKDVLIEMKKSFPGLSFDTVYRNLTLFVDLHILDQTELHGEMQFRMICGTGHHHHHFICLECGMTKTVDVCPMDDFAGFDGFQIEGHKFEIYGKCPMCIK